MIRGLLPAPDRTVWCAPRGCAELSSSVCAGAAPGRRSIGEQVTVVKEE
jgi:hypothetical protein